MDYPSNDSIDSNCWSAIKKASCTNPKVIPEPSNQKAIIVPATTPNHKVLTRAVLPDAQPNLFAEVLGGSRHARTVAILLPWIGIEDQQGRQGQVFGWRVKANGDCRYSDAGQRLSKSYSRAPVPPRAVHIAPAPRLEASWPPCGS